MSDSLFYRLVTGDSLVFLPMLEKESIHAVVTDPPYGLEFLGNAWDAPYKKRGKVLEKAEDGGGWEDGGGGNPFNRSRVALGIGPGFQDWCKQWARACFRALKPGAFLLSFGSPRTYHRLTCGIEDAGFSIKDTLMWGYNSGFPKARDLKMSAQTKLGLLENLELLGPIHDDGVEALEGRKTPMLKPAWEPIVVAQKPPDGSLIENELMHGVGGLDIDGARIPYQPGEEPEAREADASARLAKAYKGGWKPYDAEAHPLGRYPSNVLLTDPILGEESKYYLFPKAGAEGDKDATGFEIPSSVTEEGEEDRNLHPTVKPLGLMERLIKLVTRPGQVVLDPFAGSGTTLVAAKRTFRACIAVEREEKYAKVAAQRFGPSVLHALEQTVVGVVE